MPRHEFTEFEERRRVAARLFAEGRSQAEVAARLGVSRTTTSRWAKVWRREGAAGLERVHRGGRTPRLSPEQLIDIDRKLLLGPIPLGYGDLWTTPRVADVIRRETGVSYHPGHVWRLLHKLGWVRKKPAADEPEAVGRWVKVPRFPRARRSHPGLARRTPRT
jgi:transposase